jgi:hypothetical protein
MNERPLCRYQFEYYGCPHGGRCPYTHLPPSFKVCWFHNRSRGCHNGNQCPYLHHTYLSKVDINRAHRDMRF